MASEGSSEALAALLRDYVCPMIPGPGVRRILEASLVPETQAPHLAALIEQNPLYAQYLEKLDIIQEKVQKWKQDFEDEPGTARLTQFIVMLLGAKITRNAVIAIWLSRIVGGLPRKQGATYSLSPQTQLRFAKTVTDYCEERGISEAGLAYLAGLCFDCVATAMDRKGGAAKSEKRFLEETLGDGLKAAQIAHELSTIPQNLASSRYAFPAALLIHLGKVLMAASFPKVDAEPAWKDLAKHCESHGANGPMALLLLEPRKFPFTHAEAAALCAVPFPGLRPAERAIRYYQEPYLLRGSDRGGFGLGAILSASLTLARLRQPSALTSAQRSWLKEFRILEGDLQAALQRASGRKEK